jgi:hypothetical protein
MRIQDIQPGDKVRFLNDVGGGVVKRIEGTLIFVEDEIGFEIPMPDGEVVVVERADKPQVIESEPSYKSNRESAFSKEHQEEPLIQSDDDVDIDDRHDDSNPRFYLAFLNAYSKGDIQSLDMHLVNDSNYNCFYLISTIGEDGLAKVLFNGYLQPNTKEFLDSGPANQFDVNWHIQLILFRNDKAFRLFDPVNESIKTRASRFFRDSSFQANDFFYEKAVLLPLVKNELEQKLQNLTREETQIILEQKGEFNSVKPKAKPKKKPDIIEVDLHIHELLDDTKGLSNADMLKIQMDRFHSVMIENIKNKGQKIVFIHGIGNGKLKHEVRRELNSHYKMHNFQDASFREYGFGATLVII